MTTYYVSPTGSNTPPYDTPAKAALVPDTIFTYISASGAAGSIVYIYNGIYTSFFNLTDGVKHANTQVIGESKENTIIIPTANTRAILIQNAAGIVMSSLKAYTDSLQRCAYIDTDAILNNVDLINEGLGDKETLFINNNLANPTFNNCRIFHTRVSSNAAVSIGNAASATFNHCISMAYGGKANSSSWYFSGTGTITINGSLLMDTDVSGILAAAASTIVINNSVVAGGPGGYAIDNVNDTSNITCNKTKLIEGGFRTVTGTGFTHNTVTLNNCDQTNINPGFVDYPKKGNISISIDDRGNYAYAADIAALFESYGLSATYCLQLADQVTGSRVFTSGEKAAIRAMVAGTGMEVASHSNGHPDLNVADDTTIWTISAKTVTIDRTGTGTISVSGGGTVEDFKTKMLSAIKAELQALGCTVTDSTPYGYGQGKVSTWTFGECLKAAGAGSTLVKILAVDITEGYYKTELVDAKAGLEAVINEDGDVIDGQTGQPYVCNSFLCPFNTINAIARAQVRAAGFKSSRGSNDILKKDASYTSLLNMFAVYPYTNGDLLGTEIESEIRSTAKALAFSVAQTGLSMVIGIHNATDFTVEQMGWILDEWKKYSDLGMITVQSMQMWQKYISESVNWADNGDGTFTRVFLTTDGDYHLEPTSPLINAGVDVDLTTDFAGNPVPQGPYPDIGPYEHSSQASAELKSKFAVYTA